jgi:hypothetical protein
MISQCKAPFNELALGLPNACWSYPSYGLKCGDVRFVVTAPLSRRAAARSSNNGESSGSNVEMSAPCPLPGYSAEFARDFYSRHGLAVRAVGIVVENVTKAYFGAVDNVAMGVV